ncbi:MAG: DNA alkylation repair protein [Candidatus Thorarchaeota archaeon]
MTAAEEVLEELRKLGNPEQAEVIARYMKTSSLKFIGVKLPLIQKTVTRFAKGLSTEELVPLMNGLWKQTIFELRVAAIRVLERYAKRGDVTLALDTASRWIDDVDTWGLMDPLGTLCVGTLLLRNRSIEKTLTEWSISENFWRRRASILPYLHLSKKSVYEEEYTEIILQAIRPHISDKEFFVGKAAAWVLRELSKREPEIVKAFIDQHRDVMTRLVIREASKKLMW